MKIEIKDLVKTFGRTKAVDGISFDFSSGHIFGFIGPNGAGKTTTIRIMASLDTPLAGDVFYDGISVINYPEKVRFLMGYMPDSLPAHNDIAVWEYLDFFARAYGLKGGKRTSVLKDIEEFTGLGNMRSKYLNQLSKGMKQRVSMARALVHNPDILIMDEPAAGLDPRARIELRELLKILAGQGKAILISSHILSELEGMCHGAVIIEKGRLLRAGTIDKLKQRDDGRSFTTMLLRSCGSDSQTLRKLLEQPFIEEAREAAPGEFVIDIDGGDNECAELLANLIRNGIRVVEFKRQATGLEELFMNVTKGELQ
jgi:ABC-2 type transport system ATP-binding protein